MADKQTCHVTHAHWCVKDPRSGARPSSRLLLRRKEEGDAQRRPRQRHETRSFLFRSFFERIIIVSRRAKAIDFESRSSIEIRMRSHLLSKTPSRVHSKKERGREKRTRRRRRKRRRANKNAPSGDVSLRRGHADGLGGSSLGQGEHYCWCCVCVCT